MPVSELCATVDALPAMAWAASADGRERYLNDRIASFVGLDRGELDARARGDLVHPDDAARVGQALRNYELGRGFRFDCRVRHAGGGFRWLSGDVGPVRDAEARLLGWVGILTEVLVAHESARATPPEPLAGVLLGEQIRAARALCRWDQAQLARAAGVSVETIKRLEAFRGPVEATTRTVANLVQAFERAGVVFDLRAGTGPGVRLAEPRSGD